MAGPALLVTLVNDSQLSRERRLRFKHSAYCITVNGSAIATHQGFKPTKSNAASAHTAHLLSTWMLTRTIDNHHVPTFYSALIWTVAYLDHRYSTNNKQRSPPPRKLRNPTWNRGPPGASRNLYTVIDNRLSPFGSGETYLA